MVALVALVPDLGEALVRMAVPVEELLQGLVRHESDLWNPVVLPPPLAGSDALRAFARVVDALAATQTRVGECGALRRPAPGRGSGRWVSADGERDLVPLRPVVIDVRDLQVLQSAARALGTFVAISRSSDDVATISAVPCVDAADDGRDLAVAVESLARIAGLLDLAPSSDSRMIHRFVEGFPVGADVVLPPRMEGCHQRELSRIATMLCR